jgi:hypothetical protein
MANEVLTAGKLQWEVCAFKKIEGKKRMPVNK